MKKADVWLLLQAGYNANEIAAAAGVTLPVALGLMNEAIPRATRTIAAPGRKKLTLSSTTPAGNSLASSAAPTPTAKPSWRSVITTIFSR